MGPIAICNEALAELGSTFISSFDEGTSVATACGQHYPEARDATLTMHPWNFATKRVWLQRSADVPPFTWAYQYPLPVDCLLVRGTDQDETNTPPAWHIELDAEDRRVLLSNEDTLGITYTTRLEDLNLWSPLARQVLVKVLASKLAKFVTGQSSLEELKLKEAAALLPEARRSDGREGTPQVLRRPLGLLTARHRVGSRWVSPILDDLS